VYHGVRCLPHLFGFFAAVMVIFFTTPLFMASLIRNVSTFVDLSSFVRDGSSMMLVRACMNSGVSVCYFQVCALAEYSCMSSPSTHL
jgi:hypothetical protein